MKAVIIDALKFPFRVIGKTTVFFFWVVMWFIIWTFLCIGFLWAMIEGGFMVGRDMGFDKIQKVATKLQNMVLNLKDTISQGK